MDAPASSGAKVHISFNYASSLAANSSQFSADSGRRIEFPHLITGSSSSSFE
ncbi:hypothetical protein HMPREF1990_02134 [Porphyromonas gingivalis W4087]|nr:hypothetical protein HMPREF1554_01005 [Porphyromonas gingivalis F0569]ERJ85700.1 hypothetical protein HMPREF1990_02134 [Porphyromonas gingivalis W4087]ERJ86521.1 hypothetical protein HMPREF1989_01177 [Porphyromonas gingivalis F0566]